MTHKELIAKLHSIENELSEVREYLSRNAVDMTIEKTGTPTPTIRDTKGYTLEDLYEGFDKRKHYAVRLKHALERRGIYTLEEFLSISPGELLDLENIGYETLIRTKKALDKMGIAW